MPDATEPGAGRTSAACPAGYRILDVEGLRAMLADVASLRARLGGPPDSWRINEVSDGNLNAVFIAEGPAGAVCAKQALPYVRVDQAWAMPLERIVFEHEYMRRTGPHVGALAPEIYHYDPTLYCLVMQLLSPHIILRRGLIARRCYPRAAADIGEYVARACFATSALARPFEVAFDALSLFARNQALLRISVDLIFTDPYRIAPRNRWTAPYLDGIAAEFRRDAGLKLAAARWGRRFLTCPQALLHGDLHSGSVMATEDDTRVIDGEFSFMGPIGFDCGAFIANLLLNAFAQPGHGGEAAVCRDFQAWVLSQAEVFWARFSERFLALWQQEAAGDVYPADLFADPDGARRLQQERVAFVDGVWTDTVGFAAMKMIRRILGFAHVLDFESIADPAVRSACEAGALCFARRMLLEPEAFPTPAALTAAAASAIAAA